MKKGVPDRSLIFDVLIETWRQVRSRCLQEGGTLMGLHPLFRTDEADICQCLNELAAEIRHAFAQQPDFLERKHWQHIFAPLYVVSRSRNRAECGIGCGLALAHGVVRAHDGRVYVERSEVGKGTTVVVELPGDQGQE